MADRAAIRLAVDIAFAAAVVACGITVYAHTRADDIPDGLCASTAPAPRYDEMLADGRITIAAVFGELSGGPADTNAWSYRAFAAALRERGFVEVAPDKLVLGTMTIDLTLIADDPAQSTAALAGALASHDVVYYTGHSHDGDIAMSPGDDYRLIVLDSCWSTQHFAKRLLAPSRDVITNSEPSVTGSIESFLVLIDALRSREAWPLAEMNELAEQRAIRRAPLSRFKEPERYRLDVPCR
ncbi:MAG TPA: hypothetical protein VIV11_01730 [Kofleriaceae bacterium]